MFELEFISYSISKDSLIITYIANGHEITDPIGTYEAATYFVDCGIAKDRAMILGHLAISYKNTWITWRDFIIEARTEISDRIEDILARHFCTEILKREYLALNN